MLLDKGFCEDSCAYSSTGCRIEIALQLKRSPVFGVIAGMGGLVGHACELGACSWWPDGKMEVLDDVNGAEKEVMVTRKMKATRSMTLHLHFLRNMINLS